MKNNSFNPSTTLIQAIKQEDNSEELFLEEDELTDIKVEGIFVEVLL